MTKEEAIKILQDVRNSRIREAICTLHPELRESEDERIRKEIRDFLIDMECKKEWIAYLEKQKVIAAIPDELVECYKNLCERGNRGVALLINAINGNEQKEQKPEERFEEAREKYQVEWSEEDEKMIRSILFVLESYVSKAECEQSPALTATYPTYYKEIDWLKSLRPQAKKEWDTHDKAIVNCIVCCLDGQFVPEAARKQALVWFNKHRRDFLNSPSWKPSEEQMTNLLRAEGRLRIEGESVLASKLAELYEQLKKLM